MNKTHMCYIIKFQTMVIVEGGTGEGEVKGGLRQKRARNVKGTSYLETNQT